MDSYAELKNGQEYPLELIKGMALESVENDHEIFAVKDGIGIFCQIRPNGNCLPIGLFRIVIEDDMYDYKKAYHILMDYFDQLEDESKIEIDKRLKEINL